MVKHLLVLIPVVLLAACGRAQGTPTSTKTTVTATPVPATPPGPEPSSKVAAFYYPWYGTPKIDGTWIHWTQNGHTPPDDIASDYYPALGAYSSNDPQVVAQHMEWLRQAGVGVIIVSWWGRGSDEERAVPLIMQMAARYGIKVAFHIEPYSSRSADDLVQDVKYIYEHYGDSPAFFLSKATTTYSPNAQPRGMFFVWCIESASCSQQHVPASYWQKATDAIHALSQGGLVIANTTDGSWVAGGHFDGLYNYSTLHLDQQGGFGWARTLPAGALYIPSVIPGFSAQRVNYSSDTSVPRNDGQTYNEQWSAALNTGVQPAMVTITSFNEWHEGTMIELAAAGANDGHGHLYSNFGNLPPDGYLSLTRQWIDKLLVTTQAPSYRARIQMLTTSDWTTVNLASGGQWLQPALVSSSETATQAGFESGDRFILTQALDEANQGREVEMTWDIQLTGLTPGSILSWQIDRGSIGQTRLIISTYSGDTLVPVEDVTWSGVTTGRNSDLVTLPADILMGQ